MEDAQVFQTDNISSEIHLNLAGNSYVHKLACSDLHIRQDEEEGRLQIYIPRKARRRESCYRIKLPPRLREWLMTDPDTNQVSELMNGECHHLINSILNSSRNICSQILGEHGISSIDLAAANDAIVIALCSNGPIAADNDERMVHCQTMLEHGMELGMEETDLWFDPLFVVVKGMQDKQMEVLEAIKMFSDMGLNSTGGLSNNSNGMPKNIRPIMDSAMVAMAMMQGLTSAIVNPCDQRLMETVKSCDVLKGNTLYADSYLDL